MVPVYIDNDSTAPTWFKVVAVCALVALTVYIVIDSRR